jgi:hypothetical protein
MIASSEQKNTEPQMDLGNRRSKLERSDSPPSVACFPSACSDCESLRGDDASETSTRSVRFERTVTVRFTRSHRDYTPRQIKDCWYQSYEHQEIKEQCVDDLETAFDREMAGDEIDENDEKFCMRGLESYDEVAHKEKHRLRAEAANTVFIAEDDGCDDITIAEEYAEVVARSQTWANIVGLRDQRIAASIHRESNQ